jgi:L-rhamnose mutarotase
LYLSAKSFSFEPFLVFRLVWPSLRKTLKCQNIAIYCIYRFRADYHKYFYAKCIT